MTWKTKHRWSAGAAAGMLIVAGAAVQAQHPTAHHRDVDKHGAVAMGFDQTRTVHRFILLDDGGVIRVEVREADDADNRERIRKHLAHIARAFAGGDFQLPALTHSRVPPGAEEMRTLRASIAYEYRERPGGGQVRIRAATPEALAAVHAFLRFQIEDHGTGDDPTVRKAEPPR